MNDAKTVFNIELAGVPVEIKCRHPYNKIFLQDYLTDKEPLFTVEPSQADLDKILKEFEATAQSEGRKTEEYSEVFLENNAIHALLAENLVDYSVLLMHGSAIALDGEAYIFTAKSGTGKSTHARLWRKHFGERAFMINDDKPMLKVTDGGVWVYGTPWNGKHRLSQNTSAPLKAIVYLTRDTENHIEPLKKADVFPVIFKQAYYSENSDKLRKILQMENEIMRIVKCYKLGCNMNPNAATIAWEGMNS